MGIAQIPSGELRLQSLLHLAHRLAHPQRPHAQRQRELQHVPFKAGPAPPAPRGTTGALWVTIPSLCHNAALRVATLLAHSAPPYKCPSRLSCCFPMTTVFQKDVMVRHVCVVSWFKQMGPTGIVQSARVLLRCLYCGLVGGLPLMARAPLLACVCGLTFIVRVCLWWFPALLPACCDCVSECCPRRFLAVSPVKVRTQWLHP